ncbi:hypothetical protein ACJJTC_008509 [Scirpophaga incertulas]
MDNENRIVALIDMDCFYCQVEEKLNPDLKGKPIAVVQYNPWKGGGIIAVNYVARSMGVTRHMRGDEAKEKCPDIQLPCVPCFRGKADISKYRDAGKEVARVLQKFTPLLERASIDEAYLDITALVQERTNSINTRTISRDMIPNTYALGYDSIDGLIADVHNYSSESLEFDYDHTKQLLVGSVIVTEIRTAVFNETGYRCSAGIAHNKILAKLVCGMNKPDKQTILPKHSVNILYSTLSIKKVKSLGGKFGDTVCELLKINNMCQLQSFTLKELQSTFDEKNGLWLYNIARGIDLEPVQARFNPKSIGCCKQLRGKTKNALVDLDSLKKWLKDLGDEIESRLENDSVENNRIPKQMVVSFSTSLRDGRDVSSSRSYNFSLEDDLCGELFMSKALELIMETTEGTKMQGDDKNRKLKAPIKFLGISVGKFEDINDSKKTKKILDYFANSTKETTQKLINLDNVQKCEKQNRLERNLNAKEFILDKFFKGTRNETLIEEVNSTHCINPPIEPKLERNESFFAQLLKDKNEITETNDDKTVHPKIPISEVENCGDVSNDDSDYSVSTINMEINKSIALFEDSDQELDRIDNMRQLLNSKKILGNYDNESLTQDIVADDSSVEANIENTHIGTKSLSTSETNVERERSVTNSVAIYHCPICNKIIDINKIGIHSDYHIALQIRDEERLQVRANRIATNSTKLNGQSRKRYINEELIKRKPKSDNFFSQKNDLSSIAGFLVKLDSAIPTENCIECGKKIPVNKLLEHMDFHEAQKLNKQLNNKSNAHQNGMNVKRKRVSVSPVKKPKMQCKTIDSFFK